MNQTLPIVLLIAVVVVLALLVLLRARGRRSATAFEGDDVGGEIAAAVEDTFGELIGVDAHPDLPEAAGEPDELTRLKGLGPKAAAQLNALGVTRYDQLAAMDAAQLASIDARMGTFKGRLARDRWAEQAAHLAAGDVAGFEAKFGKLGG